MKPLYFLASLAVVGFLLPVSAQAIKPPAMGQGIGDCVMKQEVSLSISFNRKAKDLVQARSVFDEQMAKIEEFARQKQIKSLFLQSQNYSVSAQPANYGPDGQPENYSYQINGSFNYRLANSDTAFMFAEFLTTQKMIVSVNANAYRQGNCQQAIQE